LIVAIFFVVYQQVENYFIAPRMLRSTISLSAPAGAAGRPDRRNGPGPDRRLMAIPIAAGLKVVLGERLQARDSAAADADSIPIPMSRSALGQRPGRDPGMGSRVPYS